MSKHTCRWVLEPTTNLKEAKYCDEPVDHHYETGDDGVRRRVYETFCPLHAARAAECEASEDA